MFVPYRIRHKWNKRGRKRLRDSAIRSVRSLVEKSGSLFSHSRRIHNVTLYVLLLDQDIAALTDNMMRAVSQERRIFVARSLAVLLYEASHDLPNLLGGDYRESLLTLSIPDEWFDEGKEVSKRLNRFKNEHREFLGKIRNLVGAHRDNDAITQLEAMEALDPLEVMRLAARLQEPLNLLISLQMKLTSHAGATPVLLRDFLSKPKPSGSERKGKRRRH